MPPKITTSFSKLSEEDISRFESKHGISLPTDYKKFLLEYNGGHPDPSAFEIYRRGDFVLSSEVAMFAGLHPGPSHSLERYMMTHTGRIPPNMIVIGRDVVGNAICLSVRGKDYGTVYWWDHEGEAEPNPETLENVHPLAGSFDEFLSKLKEPGTTIIWNI